MKDGRSIHGGKGLTTDAGTHVALVANFKGTITAGRVCSDLVDFSDFLPTLADAAGASIHATAKIDGRSFLPQLLAKKASPRDSIFCWYRRNPGNTLFRFARDKRFKLYDKGDYPRAGKLYDVSADPLEQSPIEPNRHTNARKRLQAVMNSMK
jgi:arylsulfatase A